jgi:hypothetical protein
MDISRLARENELMKDYIHVNKILIDMILENRRAMAILNYYELPDFEKEWDSKHKETFDHLCNRKSHLKELLASIL